MDYGKKLAGFSNGAVFDQDKICLSVSIIIIIITEYQYHCAVQFHCPTHERGPVTAVLSASCQ